MIEFETTHPVGFLCRRRIPPLTGPNGVMIITAHADDLVGPGTLRGLRDERARFHVYIPLDDCIVALDNARGLCLIPRFDVDILAEAHNGS